jgi:VanZ family protein
VSPPVRVVDILLNFLLYVPLGYWSSRDSTEPFAAGRVVGYAALLSVLTEATQLFSHVRFPSVADVLCNLAGAWCGAILATGFHRPTGRSQPAVPDRFAGL